MVGAPPPVRHRVRADGFGSALETWGRFAGRDGRSPAAGEWIRGGDGELVRGQVDRTQLDLLTIDSSRLLVTRTPEHVARIASIRHIVVVQLDGSSVLTPADGHPPVHLRPGEVSYGDPTVGYRWEFEGPMSLMMLRAPAGALPLAPAALRPIVGRAFGGDAGYARLAVRFARDVLREPGPLSGPAAVSVFHDVVRVFGTMLGERLGQAEVEDPSEPMFRRAVGYVAEHLTDRLDVRGVAEAVGVSPRYLQMLFQQRGMSVSGWIRSRRLETARQALVDPAWATADLAQVAVAHGFADHSHFTRTFSAAFGETPSRWRERAVA